MTRRIEVHLPKPHPGQAAINRNLARFNVIDCGRRFGKSANGLYHGIRTMLDGYPVGIFTPRYKDVSEWWRELVELTKSVTKAKSEQEKRLELITGGIAELWSLEDVDAGRSRKYKRVIIDEAAKARHLQPAWEQAIRPTLTDYAGDAFFYSTPKGHNYFKTLFDKGNSDNYPDWRSWQMPTAANPYIAPAEIEAARHGLPDRVFRQEYLADFIEDGAGVFRRVMEATTAQEIDEAIDGHNYVIGVDWAKSNDFTVLTVLDINAKEVVAIDRFNQIDYVIQRGRLQGLAGRFRPSAIVAERNSIGEPNIEILQRAGLPILPFTTTNASKQLIIEALVIAFENGEISIPNNPDLVGELMAYEMERRPSGAIVYNAPPGMHDDMVMSLALAWYGISNTMPVFL